MTGRAGSDSPSVLITGAAGRLGSTVSSLLHREGFDLPLAETDILVAVLLGISVGFIEHLIGHVYADDTACFADLW